MATFEKFFSISPSKRPRFAAAGELFSKNILYTIAYTLALLFNSWIA